MSFLPASPSLLVPIAIVLLTADFARGADIDVDLDRSPCEIRISNAITEGDLATLKSKLPKDFEVGKAGPTVCLNSPGGDFVEGLKIAHYVAEGYATRLEQNATCASACSWIFMAGTHFTNRRKLFDAHDAYEYSAGFPRTIRRFVGYSARQSF